MLIGDDLVIYILHVDLRTLEKGKNGRLGSSGDSGGAVCAVGSGASVSTTWQWQDRWAWEHADKRCIYSCPHHLLLRPPHYFHYHRSCSHLCWLIIYICASEYYCM
ncbi:hypothetical protein QYF36_022960 [Acer negundo]|nr:hypothetical protein QYF36_022960 [Acer negundo]